MKFLVILIIGMVSMTVHAQTAGELFQQKSTQRKYLIKQITLLKVYLGYLKKGYDIANKGLTTIQNIKNGDFNLHRDFFGSLKQVNPLIANSAKVSDILAFQTFVVQNGNRVKNFCRDNEYLTVDEIHYITQVYTHMLLLTDISISELLTIIRANEAEMNDAERLQRIDKLHADLQDKHAFVQSFENHVHVIVAAREREKNAIETIHKQYHGID